MSLQCIVEKSRRWLAEGAPDDPEAVLRVLQQAEAEQGRRQRMAWGNGEIGFKKH